MLKSLVIILCAILLAVLGYFCVYTHSPVIEEDIHIRTTQALIDLSDMHDVIIETRGRDVILSGEVSNISIQQQAETIALDVDGVRTVTNLIKTVESKSTLKTTTNSTLETEPILSLKENPKSVVEHIATNTCQQAFESKLNTDKISFSNNSTEIDPMSYNLLDEIISTLKQCADLKIEIAGHANSMETKENNLELSQLRAEAVVKYFVSNGVNADMLSAVGYGEDELVTNKDAIEGSEAVTKINFKIERLKQ